MTPVMLALELFRSVPRYAAARAITAVGSVPGLLVGPLAPVRLTTRNEPVVRHPGWAELKVHLSGICGSDLGAVTGATSLYFAGRHVHAVRARPRDRRHAHAGLRGPARRHPRRRRPGADLRRPRPRAVRAVRGRHHQPVRPGERRAPAARPADRLLRLDRRRLGRAPRRPPLPAARGARGPERHPRRARRAARVRGPAGLAGQGPGRADRAGLGRRRGRACSPRSPCGS